MYFSNIFLYNLYFILSSFAISLINKREIVYKNNFSNFINDN